VFSHLAFHYTEIRSKIIESLHGKEIIQNIGGGGVYSSIFFFVLESIHLKDRILPRGGQDIMS